MFHVKHIYIKKNQTPYSILSYFYNIPNHRNMGFTHDYKPYKGGFEEHFNTSLENSGINSGL